MLEYICIAVIGILGKIYDDCVDLYSIKNERLLECVKTLFTVLTFLFMFCMSTNGYDILFMLFVWTFLPLVDWECFTSDPYWFSLVVFITIFGIVAIYVKKYTFNYGYVALAFILYCICVPITEIFMFKLNGLANHILVLFNVAKNNDYSTFCEITQNELECSHKKLITRCVSVLFLSFMICLFLYLIKNTDNVELKNVYNSAIYLSIVNLTYFMVSVINQTYKLYFCKKTDSINSKSDECEKKIS